MVCIVKLMACRHIIGILSMLCVIRLFGEGKAASGRSRLGHPASGSSLQAREQRGQAGILLPAMYGHANGLFRTHDDCHL